MLFLGFSIFLIVAALLLVGLLFRLNLDRRAGEMGVLTATGWSNAHVRWLLLGEGAMLADRRRLARLAGGARLRRFDAALSASTLARAAKSHVPSLSRRTVEFCLWLRRLVRRQRSHDLLGDSRACQAFTASAACRPNHHDGNGRQGRNADGVGSILAGSLAGRGGMYRRRLVCPRPRSASRKFFRQRRFAAHCWTYGAGAVAQTLRHAQHAAADASRLWACATPAGIASAAC